MKTIEGKLNFLTLAFTRIFFLKIGPQIKKYNFFGMRGQAEESSCFDTRAQSTDRY